MTKAELRADMLARRRDVDDTTRRDAGRAIAKRLAESDAFTRSGRFCCYLSTPHEVTSRYILRAVFDAGREACIPAWDPIDVTYGLFAYDPSMPLITGHKGIREPAVRIPILPWNVDCFIVPGLAFDSHGGRLGYGKGYYDRILAQAARTVRIVAVCYDWQVIDDPLPLEPHDIRVHMIITDQRLITCVA
ncbi:MAG: 5-formyltetrahydrofolate cyclo-ligase [Lentisphaerota bacterium]|jgi:5-formyltetrahydrofolate cyclo-ligase